MFGLKIVKSEDYSLMEGQLRSALDQVIIRDSEIKRLQSRIQELEREVHKNGGLVIPSAVDGERHSLVSQFGKIIKGKWDALEFLHPEHAGKMLMENYPVLPFSKPEFLDQLGERGIKLSTGDLPLLHSDGKVNLQAVYKAFEKRRVIAEEN